MDSKEKAPVDEIKSKEQSEVPVAKDKEAEVKKHIQFTGSVAKAQKEKTSQAGKSSKTPKRNREIQAFRNETLEEILKFRTARKEWLKSVGDTKVNTNAVDNTLQAVQIDKRSFAVAYANLMLDKVRSVVRECMVFWTDKLPRLRTIVKFLPVKYGMSTLSTGLPFEQSYISDKSEIQPSVAHAFFVTIPFDIYRINIMKKLGVKTSMIRPHRKTLRPRIYFTFKKSLTQRDRVKAEALLEVRTARQNEKIKSALRKDFNKLMREASARKIKESKANLKAARLKPSMRTKSPAETAPPVRDAFENVHMTQEEDDWGGEKSATRRKPHEKPAAGTPQKEVKIEAEGDIIKWDSSEEFDAIIKKLKSKQKYSARSLTEEDVNELKSLWRQFHLQLVVEKKEAKEKQIRAKRKPRSRLNWLWKKQSTQYKTDVRPCSCKFVQGDGIIVLKKGCGCCSKLPAKETVSVELKSAAEIAPKPTPIPEESAVPAKTSLSANKVTDSLEIIRKKLRFKSLPFAKAEESANAEVFNRVSAVDDSLPEDFLSGSLSAKAKPVMPTTSRTLSRNLKEDGKNTKASLGKKSNKVVRITSRVNFVEMEPKSSNDRGKRMSKTVMSVANIFKKCP